MLNDLMGQKFGRLMVIKMAPRTQKKTFWECECECGNRVTVRSDGLVTGNTKSCGCYKSESDARNVSRNHKHKQAGTRLYAIWRSMISRCCNENVECYPRYGGRGIKVCSDWQKYFVKFMEWAHANGYNDTLTIDRIDNDGDYKPSNCRWISRQEQCNNRRSNVMITIDSETKSLMEWCKIFGLEYHTIKSRILRGAPADKIFANLKNANTEVTGKITLHRRA